MFRLSTLLRCFLIVAFCLDGSASLWSASSMAVSMAGHGDGIAHGERMHDESRAAASTDADCPEGQFTGQAETGQEVGHESCDCSSAACQCPVGFTNVVVLRTVPFFAQQRVSTELAVSEPASIARGSLSPVFRPPIG